MLSRNLGLLAFLYFIQGLPYGFTVKFLPVLLRSEGASLSSVGLFKLLLAPWLCKALWAPFVDFYGTKRIWLLYSIAGLVLTCFGLSFITPAQLTILGILIFILNLCAATQDVAVDGLAMRMLCGGEVALGNTVQVVGYKLGAMFGGGVIVWLLDFMGWTFLFLLLTLLYIEAWMFAYVSPLIKQIEKNKDDVHANVITEGSVDGNINSDSQIKPKETNDRESFVDEHPEISSNYSKSTFKRFTILFREVWSTPGTGWMCVYVLIYKLGEQGMLSMLPLFLIDRQVSASDVMFWSGMLGQGLSIVGSLLGCYLLGRFPLRLVLSQSALLRLMPMGIILWTVILWPAHSVESPVLRATALGSLSLLMLLGGTLTTATFTAMMHLSRRASQSVQGSHYTCLATLEVLGKLLFASVSGWLVDCCGYPAIFLLFVILEAAVLPLFRSFPDSLVPHSADDILLSSSEKLVEEIDSESNATEEENINENEPCGSSEQISDVEKGDYDNLDEVTLLTNDKSELDRNISLDKEPMHTEGLRSRMPVHSLAN